MAVPLVDLISSGKSFPSFGALVSVIVKNSFILAGVITFVLLIFGGLGIIIAGGDSKKLEQSKQTIMGAFTGFILIISSYWILQIAEKVLGYKLLGP